MGPSATALVSDIGKRLIFRTVEPCSAVFLRQRLSVAIQRGNAAAVVNTNLYSKGRGEFFYILHRRSFF